MMKLYWAMVVIVLAVCWKKSISCRIRRPPIIPRPLCRFPNSFFARVFFPRRCPRPCKINWGTCSATCGGGLSIPYKARGQRIFNRRCIMPPGPAICNAQCCPGNDVWSNWEPWSQCSVSCGRQGVQIRRRECDDRQCRGKKCSGEAMQSQSCFSQCPVDCTWTPWENWAPCSASCDGGHQTRNRTYAVEVEHGGQMCYGPSYYDRECNTQCCPVECSWNEWGEWSSCSTSCGLGINTRKRAPDVAPSCGGGQCAGNWTETKQCSNTNCCPVDCEWGEWGAWGRCSSSCGAGVEARYRPTAVTECCGGAPCAGKNHELRQCLYYHCPVHCEWTSWGAWAPCSKSCDLGTAHRTRNIATSSEHGGLTCHGNRTHERYCNAFCCEEHCDWLDWSQWSMCSATCGLGKQTRHRSVKIHPDCKVQRCIQSFHEERNCTDACCAVDCQMSLWTPWSECTTSCGGMGVKRRLKNVKIEPECGGKECDKHTVEVLPCSRFCFNNGTLSNNSCTCADGWEGTCCEDDADECTSAVCPEYSDCFNSYGSYECVCHHNFIKKDGQCLYSTACHTGDHDCHEKAQCVSAGVHYTCECEPGFEGNGTFCSDIDECEIERNEMAWIMENGGEEADDLSEIASMNGGLSPLCHVDASCKNTIGSYVCVCDEGFFGNATFCQDIDECLLPEMTNPSSANISRIGKTQNSTSDAAYIEPCHQNATCENGHGTYDCICDNGFYGDGFICNDVNECASSPCLNEGNCKNLVNAFQCQCKTGFIGARCEEGFPPEIL